MRPQRKAEHNRMPRWAQIRDALVGPLQKEFARIQLLAARALVAKYGVEPLPSSWRPPEDDRAARLVADMIDSSRQKWRELRRPLRRAEVLAWRKQELGDARARLVSVTEVTIAQQAGADAAWAYLRQQGQKLIGVWRTERNPCPFCQAVSDTPDNVWREFYPSGPPVHPRCRCVIQHMTVAEYKERQLRRRGAGV